MKIEITSESASEILKIVKGLDESYLGLRLVVSGGGCSGFQYVIEPCIATDEMDTIVEKDGLKIVVDAFSIQYLDGATIGYEPNLSGPSITISNPNSTGNCGCGNSFIA